MHEICGDTVDLKHFCNYLQERLREGRAEYVFSVNGHEIICCSLI